MRKAVKEIQRGNLTIRQKLQFIANKIISGIEISAHEAIWMALSESRNKCKYISTGSKCSYALARLYPSKYASGIY